MEVHAVLTTPDLIAAEAACEVLRVHSITCNVVETGFEYIPPGLPDAARPNFAIVVGAGDEERALRLLKQAAATPRARA